MPASSGMRFRPQIGLMRSISNRRAHVGNVAFLLPKALMLPILVVAGLTASVVGAWTYGIHTEAEFADADPGLATGSFSKQN